MSDKYRIAFFGSSLVSAYWNGAATYYRGVIEALHKQGHEITFYEPDAFERQQNRDIPDPDYARSVIYQPTREAAEAAMEDANSADIIVKASGVGVLDRELLEMAMQHRARGASVVFWDVDAPATLDELDKDAEHYFAAIVPELDAVFTYGGGEPVVSAYTRHGARRCVPIYNAHNPDTHHPVPPDARFECDLAFVGNRLPDREERVREFLMRPAELLPEKSFMLAGSGWGENCELPQNLQYVGHLYTRDHNAFNCTPKAILNVSRESMARYGFSPATRVFEAAGAGACLITDAWKGLETFLEAGSECLVAESGDEVAGILQKLSGDYAAAIGRNARNRVLKEHTYAHRAKQLEESLNELRNHTHARARAISP